MSPLDLDIALPWVGSRYYLGRRILVLGSHNSVAGTNMTDTEWIQRLRADLLQDPYYEILMHDIGMSTENFTDVVAITNWCAYFSGQPTVADYRKQLPRLVELCKILKVQAILGIGMTQNKQLEELASRVCATFISIPTTVGKNNVNPRTAFKKGDAKDAWDFLQ